MLGTLGEIVRITPSKLFTVKNHTVDEISIGCSNVLDMRTLQTIFIGNVGGKSEVEYGGGPLETIFPTLKVALSRRNRITQSFADVTSNNFDFYII